MNNNDINNSDKNSDIEIVLGKNRGYIKPRKNRKRIAERKKNENQLRKFDIHKTRSYQSQFKNLMK